jgi:hypothetical protein
MAWCMRSGRFVSTSALCVAVFGARLAPAQTDAPPATPTATAPATQPAAAEGDGLSMPELEKLVAPIALYPDVVLAQALPAATVPLQVVEAARFAEKNPGKTEPPAGKNWELPVVNLLGFPDALKKLNEDLGWLQQLGDAMIDQQDQVFEAIQNVRLRVNSAGALPSNDKQTVIVEKVVEKEVVKIVPANPEVVYVPSYNPSVVYVDDDDDDELVAGFIGFGVGMAVGACIWDDCDWHGGGCWHGGGHSDIDIETGDINIDRGDRETNINRERNSERNVDRSKTRSEWKPSSTARTEHQARQQTRANARNPGSGLKPANVGASNRAAQDRARSAPSNRSTQGPNRATQQPRAGSSGSSSNRSSASRNSSSRNSGGAFNSSGSGSSARQQSSRGSSSRSSSGARSSSSGSRSSGARSSGGGGSRGGGGARGGGGGGRGGGGRR